LTAGGACFIRDTGQLDDTVMFLQAGTPGRMTGMPENAFINMKNRSHFITVDVEIPKKGLAD
jgi:hypothetical protein